MNAAERRRRMEERLRDELVTRFTAGCGCHGCTVVIPKLVEALVYVGAEAARERRGLRRGEPTPIQGVDAGLLLLELAAAHALGIEIPANQGLREPDAPALRVVA